MRGRNLCIASPMCHAFGIRKKNADGTWRRLAVATNPTAQHKTVHYARKDANEFRHDPHTSPLRQTIAYLRAVRLLTFKSSSHIWAELHETAFRRLGGSPRYIILDNLREGVIVSDYYDPTLNPLFKDVLAHYGVVAMPCRVRDPDRKGKVESGVGHAQKTPLKGQRFESLDLLA